MSRSQFKVVRFALKLCFRSISPKPFEIHCIFSKLWSNVNLSETVCRAYASATVTQGQGHTSRSWGLPLNLESAPKQTCIYGSHMGYPYGTHMESATGFRMGPMWVSPYAVCQMSPIRVPHNSPIKKKEMISTYLFKLVSLLIMRDQLLPRQIHVGIYVVHLTPLWDKIIPFRQKNKHKI